MLFDFDIDDLRKAPVTDERYEWHEFEVTAVNFDPTQNYACEHEHHQPAPALYVSGSSFSPKTGDFSMRGTVVYQCNVCNRPVFNGDEV